MTRDSSGPTPPSSIPDDQAWFWTTEWQAKEEEADKEIAEGTSRVVMNPEEFIAELADRAGLSMDELS